MISRMPSGDSAPVVTHLGERLRQHDVVTLLDKVTNSKRVIVDVTRRKALVSHVKEGKVLLLLDNVRELLPLLGSDIDAGRVVRAGVEAEEKGTRIGQLATQHAPGRVRHTRYSQHDRLLRQVLR